LSTQVTGRPLADADAALAARFAVAIETFGRAARRARAQALDGDGLTISQYYLVEPLLVGERRHAVGDLAAAAGVTPPTATRMLDALEAEGLVARRRDEIDRRCVHVALTDRGRELAMVTRAQIEERRRKIFEALDPDERAPAAQLLERLAAIFDDLA
jgi:DNA-binding MarR family transcriptional regulator